MDKEHLRRAVFKKLKKSKFIFNTFEWMTGYKDIRVQNSIHSQDKKKDASVMRREKKLIRDYWHSGVFHYYRYGLPYAQLSDDELLDYVPTYYHHKKLERDHEGIDTVFFGDKLNQALLFQERNIPTGEVVAYNTGGGWLDYSSHQSVSVSSLIKKTLKESGEKLFLKPTGGQGGFGIMVLKYQGDDFLVNGNCVELEPFIEDLPSCSFILQKGLIQSEQMQDINPSSVNTLRVVVQPDGDLMRMKTCIIRMGRKGKEVDNSAQGGVSVKVDTETGRVASTATAEHGGGIMTCHPDTGKLFGAIVINDWINLKTQIEQIGTKLRDFNNIALDIAVTDEGPKLLEFNFRYGIEHQQCVLGGVRRILDIYPE